jgi:hypothetical protein
MKTLLAFAGLALLLLASPALALSADPPPELPAFELSSPLAAPDAGLSTCPMLVVENIATCEFGIIAERSCGAETIAILNAIGPRLLASSAFLAACLAPPADPAPA